MILTESASLLTSYPGSLIYHLIMALILALFLGFSQALFSQRPSASSNRWMLAAGVLLAFRLALMMAAAMAEFYVVGAANLLPPLDRLVSLLGIALIAWVMLLPSPGRRGDLLAALVVGGVVVGGIAALAANLLSPALPYSGSWGHLGWILAGLLLSLLVTGLLALQRPTNWPIAASGFLLFSGGFVVEFILRFNAGALPGYVRLAELMAYPLFALAAFRTQLAALPSPAAKTAVTADREDAGTIGSSVQETITELAGLLSPSNLADFSEAVVQTFARVMKSEVCLLLTKPEKSGEFSIVTGYDLVHGKAIPASTLDATRCPTISQALGKRQSIVLSPQLHSADLSTLKEILGLEGVGPAILASVATHELAYGGLLLLSPYARRHWPREDLQTVETAASHLATRIAEILRNEVGVPKMPGASRALEEARQRIQELEAAHARLEQQVSIGGLLPHPETSPDLAALLARYGEAQATIHKLEDQIQAFRTSPAEMIAAERSPEEERLATQLQLTLQELAEARARLQFAQEEQAEVPQFSQAPGFDMKSIGSIAQDLRRPLASVMGYTNLLLGESIGLLGTMQRRFLERVRDSIDRMAILLNKLIETAALDMEGLGLSSGPADLDSCIEEAITQASSALRQRNLTLRLDLPEEVPHVMGESDTIIQILVHLINNAIGASPEGAEVVVAGRVQETDSAGFLILSISDAGAGIPSEELGHVFQRAYRDDVPPIEGLGDSGVGLSVVKALAESLGGRVWVDSEVDIGSTFTVLMPLADHHLPRVAEEIEVA